MSGIAILKRAAPAGMGAQPPASRRRVSPAATLAEAEFTMTAGATPEAAAGPADNGSSLRCLGGASDGRALSAQGCTPRTLHGGPRALPMLPLPSGLMRMAEQIARGTAAIQRRSIDLLRDARHVLQTSLHRHGDQRDGGDAKCLSGKTEMNFANCGGGI